ncbi:alpha/beta hydrolase domain-containing protein 17C [Gracilinanus agilis]|uniref:alpha/beta hydrolase domain-containing protein 17C n=1 Tax=Gracilinanus agilis TaxID=191870 RepID=UPI001CFD0AD3|nr:alpha/beta hydrolase domain-containing protein 17C [Gracilinanus agilis]
MQHSEAEQFEVSGERGDARRMPPPALPSRSVLGARPNPPGFLGQRAGSGEASLPSRRVPALTPASPRGCGPATRRRAPPRVGAPAAAAARLGWLRRAGSRAPGGMLPRPQPNPEVVAAVAALGRGCQQQQPPEEAAAAVAAAAAPGACSLHLSERADWQYSQRELDAVEVFFSRTARDNRLGCMFVRCAPSSRYTLLFSHGNAVDLGQMCSFYIGLGSRINCNIFSYDYSGYGVSSGKPSEKNLYADIDAAWQALRTRYGVSPENIILYGQSIGTVPTVDLASRYECAAVILHSPLMSGLRVAFPDTRKTYCFDAFPSIDKISKVTSPVLVIHGTEDEVIDFSHGLAMYERCPRAVEPLWVEGAGHNDIELYAQYLERLKQFISHELPNS